MPFIICKSYILSRNLRLGLLDFCILIDLLFLQRNPDIKLYGLPWGFPGWIGQGTRDPYSKPTVTADYIIRWINGAKTVYGLHIDFIGVSMIFFLIRN